MTTPHGAIRTDKGGRPVVDDQGRPTVTAAQGTARVAAAPRKGKGKRQGGGK